MASDAHTDDECSDAESDRDVGVDLELDVAVDHRELRSALEFAVAMAAEMARMKPPVDAPRDLRRYSNSERLPASALGRIRRAVVSDDLFRRRIAAGAVPELVDPIGRLWLGRPDGWQEAIARDLAEREEGRRSDDARKALKKSEKRRLGAEEAARRAVGEGVALRAAAEDAHDEAAMLRGELTERDAEVSRLRDDVIAARIEARHARDRERAAVDRLAEAEVRGSAPDGDASSDAGGLAGAQRESDAHRLREDEEGRAALDAMRRTVGDAARAADHLAAQLRHAAEVHEPSAPADPPTDVREPRRRVPLRLPGGVSATSEEAAEFLLRSDSVVLVDGYNVAMLAWPDRDLCDQRDALIDALENIARRFGATVTIVFDGTTVVGSFSGRRRMVRVMYSPEGVTADDVIRDEAARIGLPVPVVVVTNDAEIVRDVKAAGANVIASTTLVDML